MDSHDSISPTKSLNSEACCRCLRFTSMHDADVCIAYPTATKQQFHCKSTTVAGHLRCVADIRVVVKNVFPFGIPIIIRHLIFRVPKKEP